MRSLIRLLLIGLLLCGFSGRAPFVGLAQQGGSVSLRPRMTSAQPGVPEVKASVDRPRVPAGSEVVFTISPARIVSDSRYRVTLFFGDGKRQLMRQAKVAHVYPQAGTYVYSLLVEVEKQTTPTPSATPAAALPNVKLSVSPAAVKINDTVTFAAQLSRRYPNLKYRFVFGDGAETSWQAEPKATHAYHSANTFKAYVDIGVPANGSIKQAGGSQRESIKVNPITTQRDTSLKLVASSATVDVKNATTFTVRLNPEAKAVYRFEFGDKTTSNWQASPLARHQFTSAGRYSVRAEARLRNGETISDSVTIEVSEPAGKAAVDLKAIPATVPLGVPMGFQAVPSGASGEARYRFNFGDGSATTAWSTEPLQTHLYSSAGNYVAVVEMLSTAGEANQGKAVTDRERVRVTSIMADGNTNHNQNANDNRGPNDNRNVNRTPNANGNRSANDNRNANRNSNGTGSLTGNRDANGNRSQGNDGKANNSANVLSSTSPASPETQTSTETTDWWKYIIILAIVAFAVYQVSSYLLKPRPSFVPHFDPGDSKLAGSQQLGIDLQTDVDPNLSGGEFKIDTFGGNLIKSKRDEP